MQIRLKSDYVRSNATPAMQVFAGFIDVLFCSKFKNLMNSMHVPDLVAEYLDWLLRPVWVKRFLSG